MRVLLLFTGLVLFVLPASADASSDSLSAILDDLRSVEVELTANQGRIDALQAEIGQLQSLGKDAEAEILRLHDLVDEHAVRVRQIGDKYTQTLNLAQRQQAELERAQGQTWVLGAAAVVATVVAIGEALALAGRGR